MIVCTPLRLQTHPPTHTHIRVRREKRDLWWYEDYRDPVEATEQMAFSFVYWYAEHLL